ncbi:excinuclease ABC subunit C [Granulicella sibirica]|uniref:UvrB/UvrC protein n=1 Tax=Granulicella sibirica TaxID=2479048 RepID=A0A4Q0T9N0_9BACT|nr:excinuclease ABC subunit C [Granulicella sibirica]RXH58818.1 UvrB/UvrC protein [Granulicella sibirica]
MASTFHFEHSVAFSPDRAAEILRLLPTGAGVLCLRGAREADEPYLTRTADIRRRAMRLLAPPEMTEGGQPVLSKRLNLRGRVARIEWAAAGSEFEALLVLYHATAQAFGYGEARRRLRLHTPFFLRLTHEQAHPRVYATNRLSKRGLGQMYGPFPSRAAAERYGDAVLELFKLRRCHEDLEPYPEHPGCVYQQMKKCLAPCNLACTPDEYAAEALAVKAFLETRGESMLSRVGEERERASEEMDFERAASLHSQWTKVKAAASLADELVREIPKLRAVLVQRAAPAVEDERGDRLEAAIFMLQSGCLEGPQRLSTLGVRAVKEQTSVGSSLFAQPLMLQAIPLEPAPGDAPPTTDSPEDRAAGVLQALEAEAGVENDLAMVSDHLSLLRRWYYRPEKQRSGEIFFPNTDGTWPIRRILRGAARMVLGEPGVLAETQRDQAPAAKVKILHEGREGVERIVPLIARKKTRGRKAAVSMEPASNS